MTVGGDIIEITYNHPDLGSGVVYPKAGEKSTYFIGGITTASDESSVDGSGKPIRKMNRTLGFFESMVANDQNDKQEFEKVIAMSGNPKPADWTFTIINGAVYAGSGFPVNVKEADINDATFKLRIEGGQFKKISG